MLLVTLVDVRWCRDSECLSLALGGGVASLGGGVGICGGGGAGCCVGLRGVGVAVAAVVGRVGGSHWSAIVETLRSSVRSSRSSTDTISGLQVKKPNIN